MQTGFRNRQAAEAQSKRRRSGSAKKKRRIGANNIPKQPYAKNSSYDQFEHAYRTGYNSFLKYPGKKFVDVEDAVALDYEQAKTRFGIAMGHGSVPP